MSNKVLEILKAILTMALPHIKELVESKVVPVLKRKAYERLDDCASDRIEDLTGLYEKILKTENSAKKEAHLEGFKLGVEAICAIGKKLVDAGEVLKGQLEA